MSTINPAVSLGDLGLDSLMGVEVKQLLERADIVLPISEIRSLTFKRLSEMEGGDFVDGEGGSETSGTASQTQSPRHSRSSTPEAFERCVKLG